MSRALAIVLGAATTGGATVSMMSDVGGDIPRYAIVPGFWAVWFGPPMDLETQYVVCFGVNTGFWGCVWKWCPTLARQAAVAIAADAALGAWGRFFPRK